MKKESVNGSISESVNGRISESVDQRAEEPGNQGIGEGDPVEAALRYKVSKIKPDPNFVTRLAMQLRREWKLRTAPAPRRVPLWGWLSAAVATILIITFGAQALLPGKRGVPTMPTQVVEVLPTATSRPPATTAAVPQATATTAAPTPEPEPAFAADLPPAVMAAVPRPGEEVNTQAGILLQFTRAMDRASVENALRVTPEVEGTFAWQDDRTVTFKPKVLAAGTRYHVSLDVTARAANGLPLTRDLAFSFSTLDALTVTHATPAQGSGDLRGDTPVLVVFNYPMVPINCTGQVADANAGCPPLPLNFTPGVVGQGTWINTSAYRFDPLPGWNAGTTYTVEVPAGVASIAGTTLNEAVTWTFGTALPRIINIQPGNRSKNVAPDTNVRVYFNTPMDPQTTAAAFSLSAPGDVPVPGTIRWEDNNATLVFTSTQNLALDTEYVVRVTDQAGAINGSPVKAGQEIRFRTAPYPGVVKIIGTDERAGTRTLNYYESLRVEFQGLIDETTLEGHFRMTENEKPIEVNFWWDNYENHNYAYINWDKVAGAQYCLTVLPGIADRYGNVITDETTACFIAGDLPPLFAVATRQNTLALDAADAARLYFVAQNVGQATLTLATLAERGFMDYEGMPGAAIRRWSLTLDSPRNQASVVPVDLTEDGGPLPTGYYHLSWSVPKAESWWNTNIRFAVVDRHVTLKMTTEEALVWVTDLRSAQPVAGAEVRLLNRLGELIGTGVTDADGVARFTILMQNNQWDNYTAVTGVPGQPGFGVARKDWNQGVTPWDFDIAADYSQSLPYQVYLHTDRPIYRPGQVVHLRGILRNDDDARYTLPDAGQTVEIALRNANWEIVTQTVMTVDEMGVFSGDIEVAADALLGVYTLEATVPGVTDRTWSLNFTVAAYRKPEFEVAVTPEQKQIFDGEMLRTLITAQYYAGGPVGNARIHWIVRATPFYFAPNVGGWWNWNTGESGWMWYYEAKVIAEGDAMTDATGQFLLELPATLQPLTDGATAIGSQSWSIEATVTDEAGFPVTHKDTLTVHATRFYIGLKPRSWVAQAGEQALIDLLALDWDAQPVVGQTVNVSLAQRTWKYLPAKEPFADPTWIYTDTVVSTLSVTTDDAGKAEIALMPPRSGPYVVLAESRDSAGKTVRGETYLWVGGAEVAGWKMPEGQINPVADARSYRVGDTARVLVPTPFAAPYEVLMTVERGSILSVRRFTAQEANLLIEIPIMADYMPNVVVSFVAVKGVSAANPVPDVRIGMVELKVEPVERILTVEVTPDRPTYEPGDRATLTVRTRDVRGQPVSAAVALAVVDKAVLALADPNAPTLEQAFYQPRALRVFTGDGLIALFNRSAANIEALRQTAERIAKEMLAGGLGGGGGGEVYVADVRQEYPDTALWEARLQTDANGEAQVSLKLPDSLTTWVADVRAVTADTRVGQTTAEFIVNKPLFVRPVTPRFFTAGDRAEVAAVVHNNTDADIDATVRLDTNMRIGESANSQSDTAASRQISVPAHGRVRVSWTLDVPADADVAELTFSVEGGGYRDAARPTVGRESDHALPIYRYETPDVFGTTGALTEAGTRLEAIVIPPEAGPDSYLTVRLEPTLAAGMTEGLTYLEYFPHACTEQLVSRFLPNVVSYRALKSLGVSNSELEAKLRELVVGALKELYSRQLPDSGWGWWKDSSDMQMTAYVAFALIQTQRAGFDIRDNRLNRALEYLKDTLAGGLRGNARTLPQAFTLYVLSEAGYEWPAGADTALFEAREQLEVTGRAYLALALALKDPVDPRVATLLEDLRADANITARGAHWESLDSDYWVTWTRTTSIALDALARLAPDDPLIPQATRWLMIARSADRWETTQETTWAIIALTDVMLATGELQADYTWGVAVNAVPRGTGQVTAENLREPVEYTIPVSELLREWPNALEVSRGEGNGTLYYSAHLALYKPVEKVEAESRGITVQRRYCAVSGPLKALGWNEDLGDCTPVTSAKPGELVEVRLTLVLPRMRNYLVLEDAYPAGMEPVDPTLNTEQEGAEPETRRINTSHIWWWPTFDRRELRDERAVFYARQLAAGTYEVRYYLRAAIPGEYRVLPATASEMYLPEVRGRSEGMLFTVGD
ncbi:MAG TPA: Ig-like domain-containing protein [Anaerolineae bacterium]|mgnify:CR=1 FL=1|nr:Ig-like domain-containing protein [Anaerolineae bacterium]HQK15133.1 Ig-like domain-containing protein [Anaerolineae bacterium]